MPQRAFAVPGQQVPSVVQQPEGHVVALQALLAPAALTSRASSDPTTSAGWHAERAKRTDKLRCRMIRLLVDF
jgi:hypothetical protein